MRYRVSVAVTLKKMERRLNPDLMLLKAAKVFRNPVKLGEQGCICPELACIMNTPLYTMIDV